MKTKQFRFLEQGDIIKHDGEFCVVKFNAHPQGKDKVYGVQVISVQNELHDIYDKGKIEYEVYRNVSNGSTKEIVAKYTVNDKIAVAIKRRDDKAKNKR